MDDGFKRPEEVIAKEEEDKTRADDVERGDRRPSINDNEKHGEQLTTIDTSASQKLPFSKARCIAIVATIAAAPFLSVRFSNIFWLWLGKRLGLCNHQPCCNMEEGVPGFGNTTANWVQQTFAVQASVIILPTIGEALGIPTSRQQWIVSSYSLTFGCFLVCCACVNNNIHQLIST